MTNNFPAFAKLVADTFQGMTKTPQVFVTTQDGDALYAEYLAAFPEGTNPRFKEHTEHDCSSWRRSARTRSTSVSTRR